jgi:Flp pilus assembly protein TadD
LAHLHAAQQAIREGNNDVAVQECKTVLRLHASLVEARINLGLAYHLLGQCDESAAELASCLSDSCSNASRISFPASR